MLPPVFVLLLLLPTLAIPVFAVAAFVMTRRLRGHVQGLELRLEAAEAQLQRLSLAPPAPAKEPGSTAWTTT